MRSLFRRAAFVFTAAIITSSVPAKAVDPFQINAILSVTGYAAFLGQSQQQALTAAEKAINMQGGIRGTPVKFVIADDNSNPQVSLQLMNGLIAKKVSIVIGPSLATNCRAVLPMISNDGPVTYCLGGLFAGPPSLFSSGHSIEAQVYAVIDQIKYNRITKIALLTDDTSASVEFKSAFTAAASSSGGLMIVDHEEYSAGATSIGNLITHVASSGAQALIAWSTGASFRTVLQSLRGSGLAVPVVTNPANLSTINDNRNLLPEKLFVPGPVYLADGQSPTPSTQAFLNAMAQVGVVKPDPTAAGAWDVAMLVAEAFRKKGLAATADQLRDALVNSAFNGVLGHYDFGHAPRSGLIDNPTLKITPCPGTASRICFAADDGTSGGGRGKLIPQ